MDLIIIIIIGAVVTVSGVTKPSAKDPVDLEQAPKTEVTTSVIQEIKPEPEPEPEPEPQPAKEPEPEPEPQPEPEPELQPKEPIEEVNAEQAQEQDAKPEEEEVKLAQEEVTTENEEKGISMLNIILYILGAITVVATAVYYFMRREPEQSAADIARSQSKESTPEPQEEQPVQEETNLEPEPETEQPVQEETQTETTETEENPTTENTNDQSSNNDDENNNR